MKAWWDSWKVRWVSKTLWANIAFALLAGFEMNWHLLRGVIGEAWWGIGAFVVALTNIVLRVFTTQPLIVKAEPPAEK